MRSLWFTRRKRSPEPLLVVVGARAVGACDAILRAALTPAGVAYDIREARSTAGLLRALEDRPHLVVWDDSLEERAYTHRLLRTTLDDHRVVHCSPDELRVEPRRFLDQAVTRTGLLSMLPHQIVALVSYSGGVGKTTLTLHLVRYVHRRARLRVAAWEIAHGSGAFSLFTGVQDPTIFDLVQRGRGAEADGERGAVEPLAARRWQGGISIVPADARRAQALLARPDNTRHWFLGGHGFPGFANDHVLVVLDVLWAPHTLLTETALNEAVDHYVVLCSPREDTVAQGLVLAEELRAAPRQPRVSLVLNRAESRADAATFGSDVRFDLVIRELPRAARVDAFDGRLGAALAPLVYPHARFG